MRGQANGEDRRLQDDEEQQQRGEEQEQQQRGEEQEQQQRGEEQEQQQRAEEQEQQQQRVEQRHHVRQRTASRPSSGQQPGAAMRNVGYVGKHRLSAAIARLDQELQSLQDELNELETLEPASAACHEVITSTVGKPDPLLPTTSGPENSSWDRWFQRVRSSRSNKWWASKGSDFP